MSSKRDSFGAEDESNTEDMAIEDGILGEGREDMRGQRSFKRFAGSVIIQAWESEEYDKFPILTERFCVWRAGKVKQGIQIAKTFGFQFGQLELAPPVEAPRKRSRFKSTAAIVRTELKSVSAFKKEIPPHEVVDDTHVAHFSSWRVLVHFFL